MFKLPVRLQTAGVSFLLCLSTGMAHLGVLDDHNHTNNATTLADGNLTLVQAERERCGEIIDSHLHLAEWFQSAKPLLEELDEAGVDRGVLYAVYAPIEIPMPDPNFLVSALSLQSFGRIVGLASLNTTGNWEEKRESELARLSKYLKKRQFVGAKLAPPHTCLEMQSDVLKDVVETVANSPSPVMAIHTGTTPFCGPFGEQLGFKGCCGREYVDPSLLDDLVVANPNVTFVLLHSGFDFLPPDDENYYNGELVDAAIEMASTRSNVYLEISALQEKDADSPTAGGDGLWVLEKIVDAGLANRVIWGSDANHFKGNLAPALEWAVSAMISAGFSEEERCSALGGAAKMIASSAMPSFRPAILGIGAVLMSVAMAAASIF